MLWKWVSVTFAVGLAGCIDIGDIVFDEPGGGGGGGAGGGADAAGGGGAAPGGSYVAVVMADGPIGYWRLGSVETGRTPDETAGARHAFLDPGDTGTFDFQAEGAIAGDSDPAMTVTDGASIEVATPHPFGFPGRAPFTLEAWIKKRSQYAHFLTCESTEAGYFTKVSDSQLQHYRKDTAQSSESLFIDGLLGSDYYHVVITYDGTTALRYLNGGLVLPATDMLTRTWVEQNTPFRIVPSSPGDDITIDEVAVYDYPLPEARVAKHYACGKNAQCD